MRAYKFLDAQFGLKSLYERRLKQSRISDLNDPFELTPYDLTNPVIRHTFLQTRDQLDEARGMLCFSASWSDPVIWAHYSDKHRGLCLGFKIPKVKGDPEIDESRRVRYIRRPLKFPANFESLPDAKRFAVVEKILFTKFVKWDYEKEIRIWAHLQHEENGLYYFEFDGKLQLVEVIIGAKCSLPRSAIERALGSLVSKIKIRKARAAYNGFKMTEDKDSPAFEQSELRRKE
jgi:DUF2971 family protein